MTTVVSIKPGNPALWQDPTVRSNRNYCISWLSTFDMGHKGERTCR